jgi:hypothetical protein
MFFLLILSFLAGDTGYRTVPAGVAAGFGEAAESAERQKLSDLNLPVCPGLRSFFESLFSFFA